MLEKFGTEKENEHRWYRENVAHIDSISRYCIELSDNEKEEDLLHVLSEELGNFLSHPNAKSYVCFDLNLIMTRLYFEQADKYPDYLQKCIDLWELNRVQFNVVKVDWQEYDPHYIDVLKILMHLYEADNNPQKVTEMQNLIKEVSEQAE